MATLSSIESHLTNNTSATAAIFFDQWLCIFVVGFALQLFDLRHARYRSGSTDSWLGRRTRQYRCRRRVKRSWRIHPAHLFCNSAVRLYFTSSRPYQRPIAYLHRLSLVSRWRGLSLLTGGASLRSGSGNIVRILTGHVQTLQFFSLTDTKPAPPDRIKHCRLFVRPASKKWVV